jgi:hypothetical protein
METGIVTETKHKKTRTTNMKTWIFATSNNVSCYMGGLGEEDYCCNGTCCIQVGCFYPET